jgi:hypothetical protein
MNPNVQAEISSETTKERVLQMRLSDTEKGNLFLFCQNQKMVFAVEKALMACVYEWGTVKKEDEELTTINWAMGIANADLTSEEKGKRLEILANAVAVLQDAFKQISKFGVEKAPQTSSTNPAV